MLNTTVCKIPNIGVTWPFLSNWSNARSLAILKERTEEVSYSVEKDYVDDSKSILAEIKGEGDSDNDEDELENIVNLRLTFCER